jgi:hypothetical protein
MVLCCLSLQGWLEFTGKLQLHTSAGQDLHTPGQRTNLNRKLHVMENPTVLEAIELSGRALQQALQGDYSSRC